MTLLINRSQTIGGIPIFEVRRFTRYVRCQWSLSRKDLAECLPHRTRKEIKCLWGALLAENYIGYGRWDTDDESMPSRLTLTEKGAQLSRATGARPITRATANRLVEELLARADIMRSASSRFAYRPAYIYLYGSFLSDKTRLGDVDVGIEWDARYPDYEEQIAYNHALSESYQASGRRFDNFSDYLDFGFRQSALFLRNRARALSLHRIEEPEKRTDVVYRIPHRLVYERGRRLLARQDR